MASATAFQPQWLSVPGETILELCEQRHLSPSELAARLGRSVQETTDLLTGAVGITSDLARRLATTLGGSAEFWQRRESQFRNDLAHVEQTGGATWLTELPTDEMVRFGWNPGNHDTHSQLLACMNFFGVSEIEAWREKYSDVLSGRAFKTSPSFDSQPAAVAAWLRRAELEAEKMRCEPWNSERFKSSLSAMRAVTRRRRPNIFLPMAQQLCAESGVALVILRAPKGCRASGATWFLSESKAVIVLSFRYLSDDHFWFTFFHEAGHLLLHEHTALFLEGAERLCTKEEEEANAFAATTLIPPSAEGDLLRLPLDGQKVISFARKIGISPGIVVGQLQHRKVITHRQLNSLKTRFEWTVE